jgi:Protein of unknown function (DUF2958)
MPQKLMTKAIEKRFEKLGRQEEKGDEAIVAAKFFNPTGRSSWFATEYDPTTRLFYGYVVGEYGPDCDERGYFCRDELETITSRCGLHMERDQWWREVPLSAVLSGAVS